MDDIYSLLCPPPSAWHWHPFPLQSSRGIIEASNNRSSHTMTAQHPCTKGVCEILLLGSIGAHSEISCSKTLQKMEEGYIHRYIVAPPTIFPTIFFSFFTFRWANLPPREIFRSILHRLIIVSVYEYSGRPSEVSSTISLKAVAHLEDGRRRA